MSWSERGRSQVTLLVRRIPALLMTRQKPGGCATLSSETRRQEDNPWIVFALFQVPSLLSMFLSCGQICLAGLLPGYDLRLPEERRRQQRVQVLGSRGLCEAVSKASTQDPPTGLEEHASLP